MVNTWFATTPQSPSCLEHPIRRQGRRRYESGGSGTHRYNAFIPSSLRRSMASPLLPYALTSPVASAETYMFTIGTSVFLASAIGSALWVIFICSSVPWIAA